MDMLTRRSLLGATVAGALATPFARASSQGGGAPAAARATEDKLTWTLAAPSGSDRRKFQDFVRRELAKAAADRLDGTTRASVTLHEFGTLASASLGPDETIQVDAVLEITSRTPYAPLKEVNAHLLANCGAAQGWRVKPTTIYDTSVTAARGATSKQPHLIVFVQRLDGKTPDFFNRNWYIHAGHLDGEEAETAQSRADRAAKEKERPGLRYVQNRVVEPITPTDWLIHGYTELLMPDFGRGAGPVPRYTRDNGEEFFDEWPPRIMQGYEYRIV